MPRVMVTAWRMSLPGNQGSGGGAGVGGGWSVFMGKENTEGKRRLQEQTF